LGIEVDRLGETIQRACGAGESIKPRVERSGTLGKVIEFGEARGTGDSRPLCLDGLPPASRAGIRTEIDPRVPLAKPRFTLGFMLSPAPQAG